MSTYDLENPNPLPGDALRDEAANLLSIRYGRPVREELVGGKKVDLHFTFKPLGKTNHIFVEAKDYASPLTRAALVDIWADYSGIVERNQPASLLVVTRAGLAPGAQGFVDSQSSMAHQTIWELENDTLGLTEYIRSLEGLFDEDGLSRYYVESLGQRVAYDDTHERLAEGEPTELFAALQSWIASPDPRPVAILGGYGAGKTSLARRLIAAQAKLALADPLARRPVLIRLGELTRFSSIEGLLGGQFTYDFPVDGFNVRRFLDLNAKGRMLIVLDGFDEMKHAMSWADFRHQISDLNKLTGGAAKVVLLGRPSAFTSTEEHFHVLRGYRKWEDGYLRLPDWPDFIEFDLCEFTREQRTAFITGYLTHRAHQRSQGGPESENWIRERVQEVDALADADPDLFSKPVHAKILVDLASDPQINLRRFADNMSRWALYELFFQSLIERESEKAARRPLSEHARLDFLREIAFWLWTEKAGATSFAADDIPDILLARLPGGEAADIDALKREYLIGSFLEKKSGDIYFFGHRSFAEYLVADRMLNNKPSPSEQSVYSALVRDGVLTFLDEAPDKRKFASWLETISQAQGDIHYEYLAFLCRKLGGRDAFVARLETTSIWLPILAIFEDDLSYNEQSQRRLLAAMQTDNKNLFALLLHLLLMMFLKMSGSGKDIELLIAAAVLDRVFIRSTHDEASKKAYVTGAGEDARQLAYAVTPEVTNQFGERALIFRGRVLTQEIAERLRVMGMKMVFQPPAAVLILREEARFSWSAVLASMSQKGREVAIQYFRGNDTLSGVYIRQTKPTIRKRDAKKSGD